MPLSPTKRVHGFEESRAYKDAGRRLDQLAQAGLSWSGHERNCAYLNTGNGRFANISAVSGFDFADDGRSLALVDWDHDGDLDLWAANRTGPRIRYLRNDNASEHHYLAIRLEGRNVNRDAIGARVEVTLREDTTLIKTLRAGEGFLGQSSKWLHFGLGQASPIQQVTVRWPDGDVQTLDDLKTDQHYLVVQGETNARPWQPPTAQQALVPSRVSETTTSEAAHIVLRSRVPLPALPFETLDGQSSFVGKSKGVPTLVVLWSSSCQPCMRELNDLASNESRLRELGPRIIALCVDSMTDGSSNDTAQRLLKSIDYPFEAGLANPALVEKLQLVHDHLFRPHQSLAVPASFLIDANGQLATMTKGPLEMGRLEQDIQNLALSGPDLLDSALPFPGKWFSAPRGLRLIPLVASMLEEEMVEDATQYVEEYHEQLAPEPGYKDLLYRLGRDLLDQGQVKAAIAWFRKALEAHPDDANGYYNLGFAFSAQSQTDAAIEHYQRAIKLNPAHVKAINNLGNLYLARQDFQTAERVYLQALSVNPELADIHFNLANAYLSNNLKEKAQHHFQEAVRINPQHARAHNNLGIILSQSDLPTATQHYRKAVHSDPRYAQAHNNLATALAFQGQLGSAITHYRHAIRFQPKLADAHANLGRLLARRHRYLEAIDHLGLAVELNPDAYPSVTLLAWLLATHPDQDLRDPAKALQLATRAVELTDRRSPGALDTLAAAYASAGEF